MESMIQEKRPLKVLYLEDSPRDAEIIREMLAESGYELDLDCATNKAEFVSCLSRQPYDLVLSDFNLPGFDAFGALRLSNDIQPDTPFICVSGSIGEETAIELLKQGAVDYVLKDRLVRLPFAARRAIEEAETARSRRLAEKALKKTEARFRSYFELSIAGIAITSPTASWIEVNDYLCEMLGFSREELKQRTWSELTHPEDLDNDLKHFKRVLAGEIEGYSIDKRFIRKDGKVIWTSLSVRCVRLEDGKVDYFVALFIDISDRKRAEEKIRESEEKYRSIFENSNVGILLTVPDGAILSANDYACRLFGMTEEELCQGGRERIVDMTDPRMPPSLDERQRTGRAKTELTFIRKDGSKFEGEVSSVVFTDSGGKERTSMILQDLTERKKAEKALHASEEKYRSIFENVQDVYYETSFDGTLLEISPSIELISQGQYRREDLIGKSMYEFYTTAEDRDTLVAALQKKGTVNDYEVRLKNRDGSLINCSLSAKIKADAAGRPEKIIGSMHDITERKRAEEELQFRNIILTTQQEAAIDGILVVDEASKIVSTNRRFAEMWDIPRELLEGDDDEPVLGSALLKVPDPRAFQRRIQYLNDHRQEIGQDEIVLKNGRVFDRYSAPMTGPDGRYFGRVWYFRDITERKKSEEQIRRDLRVKEVMLREIHHRVRNNLNVITSLLNLQCSRITTKKQALEAFEESKNRIYAMALVHANLYKEEDFSRVDLKSFVVNLTQNLKRIYSANAKIEVQIEDIELDLNNAIPCGLILNELTSNAMQHAFPGKRKGRIMVGFRMADKETYELTVEDNGTGLTKEIDVRKAKSLGLLIVNQLADQIDGDLKITRGKGTRFQITFPVSGT